MRTPLLRLCVAFLFALTSVRLFAAPIDFDVPAQPADAALLQFSKQARTEVLFSSDELHRVQSSQVRGQHEPQEALRLLLNGTGFTSRQNTRGKFVVTRAPRPTGTIKGRLLTPEGVAAYRVRVSIPELHLQARTDENGDFAFTQVPAGIHRVVASAPGYAPLHIEGTNVEGGSTLELEAQTLQSTLDPLRLEPFVVQGQPARSGPFERSHTLLPPRTAAGNLDLPRTENDALPYTIYDREQITRSGVVTLTEFLERELLDSSGSTALPLGSTNGSEDFRGSNLNLRGYGDTDETIILVNGRRLPEMLTADSGPQPPDVNLIPMSMVEQVQVLPVSAAALYSGNPVGGVINIVLRPDVDTDSTEVVATYTNALGDFDAPQRTVSLMHAHTLLDGALRIRLNATATEIVPATEAELRHRSTFASATNVSPGAIFFGTPNVRTADLSSLFGPGTSPYTSVAPGGSGSGGLAAFAGRAGVRNIAFFDTPGDTTVLAKSPDSTYGRPQTRAAYFMSAVYDMTPWLQFALDGTYAFTRVNRGYDVLTADLSLSAGSPLNPFGKDVFVSLGETTPLLGQGYSEGRLEYASVVFGALLKLPADWRTSFDVQYAENNSKYRGISHADKIRWQELVDTGAYNPLRDTQVFGPPAEFYDRVVVYRGGRGRFVKLGSYQTVDTALRVTNRAVPLPTGPSSLNLGFDYRNSQMDPTTERPLFGDGSAAGASVRYSGRTLQRYSVFGELQAPLLPQRRLPRWLRGIEADLAVRYIASDAANEANFAPTYGLKADFVRGLTVRGSITTSNRLPTPYMSRRISESAGPGSGGLNYASITDPRRNEQYDVIDDEIVTPDIIPESAVTQTAGLIYQRGKTNRVRFTADFVDTQKTDELVVLNPQAVLNLESILPERVQRESDTASGPGRVVAVRSGIANMNWRHSQHWNVTANYARRHFFGGTVDVYGRVLYFQMYKRQVEPDGAVFDELNAPSGSAPNILRYRAQIGTGWSNRHWGFGLDHYYYHARKISAAERPVQGSDHIDAYWQTGAYVQTDLGRFLPWKSDRYGLRGQLRVNNIFDRAFPRYANEPTGSGVQAYGDWRGRTYSMSVTATF